MPTLAASRLEAKLKMLRARLRRLVPLAPIVGVLVALLSVSPARAGDSAAAELLFQKGRSAMEKEDYETACARFDESFRLDRAVGTLMNLAVCEEKVGRLASAWERWQEVLRQLDEEDRRREFAETRARAIEQALPRLTIELAADAPRDARVYRDGTELGSVSWGEAIPVDPGAHLIRVEHPGFETTETQVEVAPGARERVTVDVGEKVYVPTAADLARAKRRKVQRISALASAGVAVGGFAMAGVTGALLPGTRDDVQAGCDASTRQCDGDGAEAAARGRTLLTLNTVGWAVGAAASSLAIVLWATAPKKGKENALATTSRGTRLSLTSSGLLSLEGSF